MGTKLAPAYANMFMGRLEKLFMSVAIRPFSWLRFIDDKDMKWLHCRDNLDTFLQEANSFHSTTRFTAAVSNDKHVFLDTQSRLDEDRICTYLYTKPTDTHQYLLPTSCHPKHYARISHIVLHCAPDAFTLTQTCLNSGHMLLNTSHIEIFSILCIQFVLCMGYPFMK